MSSIYEKLSSAPLIGKSYSSKFLFIAFLGIHVPLIGLFVFLLLGYENFTATQAIVIVLFFTLLATGATLFILNSLILPIRRSEEALEQYLENNRLPNLPLFHQDEAGRLMSRLQLALNKVDILIKENENLVSLLSHDMRTPLNQILALTDVIKITGDAEQRNTYVQMLEDSTKFQLNFLEQVLTILKNNQKGVSGIEFSKQPLLGIVENAILQTKTLAENKGISFEVKVPKNLNIAANELLLNQAFSNLINNAIKFSHKGQKIEIFAAETPMGIEVKVKDYGIGFEPEKKDKIFERFTKEGRSGTAGEPSSGVGLFLVKEIVNLHGGIIESYSEGVQKGATFTLLFNFVKL
jgi:signal transduction histidine kinase